MQLKAGIFIKSTDALKDTVFDSVTIFITTYNHDGAVGFVVNKPFGRYLNELEEFRHSIAFPLFNGGPVDTEHLFFLHRQPGLITDGTAIAEGIFYGGNFSQAVAGINNKSITQKDIKIFVGYCGWDAGELQAEIQEGSWTLPSCAADDLFDTYATD